ncbi:MAG TPA: hypothetical protein PLL66_01900 [Bacteroidales bacterium]|nr:hypothetical protein [Bacteroidales bacterium]
MRRHILFFYFISVTYFIFPQECTIHYEIYTDTLTTNQTVIYTDTSITIKTKGLNSYSTKKILFNEKTILYSFVNNDTSFTKYNYTYSESFKTYNLINKRLINDGTTFNSETANLKRKLKKYKKITPKISFTKQEKTILNYNCSHALIKIEDKTYEVWFTDEIIDINNKTANTCSIYSSIKGVIIEEYISGKLYKKAIRIE